MVFTRKPLGFSTGYVSLPEGTLHGRPLFQVFPSLGIFGGGFHSKKEMYFLSQKPNTVLKKEQNYIHKSDSWCCLFLYERYSFEQHPFQHVSAISPFPGVSVQLDCHQNQFFLPSNHHFAPPPHRTKAGFFVSAAWKIFSISSREPSS